MEPYKVSGLSKDPGTRAQGLEAGIQERQSNCHHPDFLLDLGCIHHRDCIPGTAVQETAIWTFADALFASDAEDRVHLNPPERRIVFIRHPKHAVFYWAIFHAGGRTGTARAALGDNSKFFGFFLARGDKTFGFRLKLEFVRYHPDSFGRSRRGRHAGIIAQNVSGEGRILRRPVFKLASYRRSCSCSSCSSWRWRLSC